MENTVIEQELIHKIKEHKGQKGNGLILVKIDLKKAYNRLEWSFLDEVLKAQGFSDEFKKLILNGSVGGTVHPCRGLRQGDPLSLFLFILCAELFSRLMHREEKTSNLQGIKISRGVSAISHLLYADDIVTACR